MEKSYLSLILTFKCKENCRFCFIDKQNLSLKKETAEKAVDFFLNGEEDGKTIKFFGGEPLLEFDLLKNIVYFCKKRIKKTNKRISFILPSSGTLLTEDILNFIKLHQIELVLDSLHLRKIRKGIFKKVFFLPFLTLTINIFPDSAKKLFKKFKEFYNQGFRRFNFLPFYYNSWPENNIKVLKTEFDKIKSFYEAHPGVYFKNLDLKGDVPLFNTCLTCDTHGNLFSSNAIIFRNFSKFKKYFSLGNINEINSKKDPEADLGRKRLINIINHSFSKKILKDTFRVDKILGVFVNSLRRTIRIADIKVGSNCNNRCKFCVRRKKEEIVLDKTAKEVIGNLQDARRECNGVVITGGEASIRKDFLKLISYAKRLGYEIILVQTNGRMFAYKDFCHKAIEAGANRFGVAIHGHIPELHDFLTSSQGSFLQTIKAIKNLKELNQPVFTNTVVTRSNYRYLAHIAQLLVNLSVDQFQFAFVHAMGSAKENFESVVPRISMVMPYIKEGLDIGIKAKIKVMTEAIPFCLMDGYEDYIAEKNLPSTKIYEFSNKVIDFDKIRPEMAKAKGKECKMCKYFAICEGTWREYPERFGWSEFKPVL